jgi:trehalose 6-phosphate synthase
MARTIGMALAMPAPERRMRWEAMMTKLRTGNIQHWFESFLTTLESTQESGPSLPAEPQAGRERLSRGSVLQWQTASSALH